MWTPNERTQHRWCRWYQSGQGPDHTQDEAASHLRRVHTLSQKRVEKSEKEAFRCQRRSGRGTNHLTRLAFYWMCFAVTARGKMGARNDYMWKIMYCYSITLACTAKQMIPSLPRGGRLGPLSIRTCSPFLENVRLKQAAFRAFERGSIVGSISVRCSVHIIEWFALKSQYTHCCGKQEDATLSRKRRLHPFA